MDHAKRLYMINEFDREYKHVHAKAKHSATRRYALQQASLTITKRLHNTWPNYIVI